MTRSQRRLWSIADHVEALAVDAIDVSKRIRIQVKRLDLRTDEKREADRKNRNWRRRMNRGLKKLKAIKSRKRGGSTK